MGRATNAFHRLIARLPGGEFGRGVAMLVTGTGVAQLLVVAFSPFLTRLYPPAAYGAFVAAISVVSILIAVSCLRYEYAITLPESDVAAANVLALALLVNLTLSIVVGIVLLAVGPGLFGLIGATALAPYAVLLALGQLGGGTATALANWAVRTRTFGEIAAARMAQAIGLVVVQIGLGLAGFGAPGLLVGDVVGRVSGSGRLARSAWRGQGEAIRRVSARGIAQAANRYRRFPLFSSPSALLSVVAVQAPLLAIVALYGTEPGGRFALADRVSSIPLTLVAGAVGQVYLGQIANLRRQHAGGLQETFIRTTRRLLRLGIGPALLLAVLAPVLAGPVFGDDWSETGIFVAVLAPMYLVSFVTAATGDTLYVLERQDLQMVREAIRLTLLGGAIPLALWLGLGPLEAIVLLSAAGTLAYGAYGLISWVAIAQEAGRPPRDQSAEATIAPIGPPIDGSPLP